MREQLEVLKGGDAMPERALSLLIYAIIALVLILVLLKVADAI